MTVSNTEDGTVAVPEDSHLLPVTSSFEDLMAAETETLWTFESEDLTEKPLLIGVPFVITEIAYRYAEQPHPINKGEVLSGDYVSVTARVASLAWMEKAARRAERLGVVFPAIEPESFVVFNDGSTGIRRQLTGILHNAKLIDVGGDPVDGPARYDRKFFDWTYPESTDKDGDMHPPVFTTGVSGKPLVIQVLKGLRVSTYAFGTGEATTYYLS